MLNERIFLLGGTICAAGGILFLGSLAYYGALAIDPLLGLPGVLFLVMAVIFLYTGFDAARARRALLAEGTEGRPR